MSTYTVRATRWAHGWELHIDGFGVTQSRNLDGAEQMVRDYIESLTGLDTSNDEITIKPEVGDGLDEATQAARDAVKAADRAVRNAAAQSRQAARDLKDAGLSGRDIAAILRVSAQRVSQLLKGYKTPMATGRRPSGRPVDKSGAIHGAPGVRGPAAVSGPDEVSGWLADLAGSHVVPARHGTAVRH